MMKMVPCVCGRWAGCSADKYFSMTATITPRIPATEHHRAPWLIRRGALLIAPHVRVQIINYLVVLQYYLLICGLPANIVLCIVLNTAMGVQYTEG